MDKRLRELQTKADVFIICPVRKLTLEVRAKLEAYVKSLEDKGLKVHWPPRDTDQTDPVGMRIVRENRLAMLKAAEIHIWWEPTSDGSKADIGALIMLLFFKTKKVVLINKVKPTPNKSFENILLKLSSQYPQQSRDAGF